MNNDSLTNAVNSLKEELLNNDLIKEFLRLKKEIAENKELTNLQNEILYLKKCKMTDEEKDKLFELETKYYSNPLVKNFQNVKEDVDILLNEIKSELNV